MLRQARHERISNERLIPHPAHPARGVRGMTVSGTVMQRAVLTFVFDGEGVAVPPASRPMRADGLWRTTCFELFVKPEGGDEYFEFNFSPSTAWAAYCFDGYRDGMSDADVTSPRIEPVERGLRVTADLSILPPPPWRVGLSAVIEETDGTKSYWALTHPPGKPDFHHPDCFALELPALGNP